MNNNYPGMNESAELCAVTSRKNNFRLQTTTPGLSGSRKALLFALLLAMAFLGLQKVKAQSTANYSFAVSNTASLTNMSSGTTTLIAADIDDAASAVTNIGFEFFLNGVRYTQFSVSSNGTLQLGATAIASNSYNPLGVAGQALITSCGSDQRTHAGNGKVHYIVNGTAPNRVLVVEWLNMQTDYNAGGNADLTYQLRLYETSGVIESVYGAMTMSTFGAGDAGCQSPQFGFTTGTTAGNVGVVTAAQSGTPAPTYNGSGTTIVNNLYTAGTITALNSAANGSRKMFTYTPPVATAPSGLNFTAVTAIGTTLNWTDNSSNEVGFAIYRSTDGVNYSYIGQTAANVVSSAQSSLFAGTTYYWQVYAITEGAISGPTSGTQATLAAGNVTSNGTGGGLWSNPATWSTGVVPTTMDSVTIKNGDVVTIDIAAVAYSLTVGEGASGILEFEQTTARTLTVGTNVSITAGGTFRSSTAGTQTGHVLSVNGNLVNNGTLSFSTNANTAGAGITFTGAANNTFGGTGAITDIRTITINKGTSNANILEMNPTNFSVRGTTTDIITGGFLVLTNGTFKISGSYTYTGRMFGAAAYTIGATTGVWLNNANFTIAAQNASAANNGLLRISSGTWNVGTAAGNSIGAAANAVYIIEGGTMNVAGRFATANAITYTQSGGTVNLATIGNAGSGNANASYSLGSTASAFTMSGGTINLVQASTGATPVDWYGNSINMNITGGVVNAGTAATTGAFNFRMRGNIPNISVDNTTNNKTVTFSAQVNSWGDVTINTGATLISNGQVWLVLGTTITNNGTMTGTAANSRFYFQGFGPQVYKGSGLANELTVELDNPSGLTIDPTSAGLTVTSRANFFQGGITNANKITFGAGAATSSIVQFGIANTFNITPGNFDVAPNFNIGTGGQTVFYLPEPTPHTIGPEIQPSRILTAMTVNNTNGVVMTGGNISVSNGASPTLTMTLGNITTGNDTLILGASTAVTGVYTYASGTVVGKFRRWISAAGGTTDFPVGIATAKRTASFNFTTPPTTGGTLTTQWVSSPGGNNGLPLMDGALSVPGTSNDGYWRAVPGNGLTGGAYTGTFTATGISGVTDVTKLVLVERLNSSAPWTLDGTLVTGSGTLTTPVLSRTGMTGYTEYGIGSVDFCPVPTASISGTSTICNGNSTTLTAASGGAYTYTYTWNTGATTAAITVSPAADSVYKVVVSNGCRLDSTTYNVTVNQNSASAMSVSGCDSVVVNGTTYTATGTYTQHMNNFLGCDSTITINAVVTLSTSASITAHGNDSVTVNTITYTMAGVYTQNLTNAAGCDSTLTITVSIANSSASTMSIGGCDSVTVNGISYMTSGIYTQHLTNAAGADSALTITATVTHSTSSNITVTGNDSTTVNGVTYTANGVYTQHLSNAVGCDSLITITVNLAFSTSSAISVSGCSSVNVNGTTYSASGVYTQHMPNAAGADSTITITATVNQPSASSQTLAACDSLVFNSITYYSNAVVMDTIPNAAGCDSVITTTINIGTLDLSVTMANDTLWSNNAGATYQWIDCNTNTAIGGETNQYYAPGQNGSFAVVVSQGICSDTSACQSFNYVGIKQATAVAKVSVYPNPGTGVYNVSAGDKITGMKVFNGVGEMIYQSGDMTSVIDISNQPSGVYMLHVTTAKGTILSRIVKQQ